MAHVEVQRYGGIVVFSRTGAEMYAQSDWENAGIASRMGWVPCPCGETDGTVDCQHRTASEMLSEAFDYIEAHEGEGFDALEEYFE